MHVAYLALIYSFHKIKNLSLENILLTTVIFFRKLPYSSKSSSFHLFNLILLIDFTVRSFIELANIICIYGFLKLLNWKKLSDGLTRTLIINVFIKIW